MPRYKLSIDKTINFLDHIEVETDLSEIELDALLDKVENDDVISTEEYIKRLKLQGVQVVNVVPGCKSYYSRAEVIEIEQVDEQTVFEFLTELKKQVTPEEFKTILAATDANIKFNRVGFNKRTTPEQYIAICKLCKEVVLR